jgi:hypothetical protein
MKGELKNVARPTTKQSINAIARFVIITADSKLGMEVSWREDPASD